MNSINLIEKLMSTKTSIPSDPTIPSVPTPSSGEDFKDPSMKYNMSKFEYDLYHEEDDKSEKVVRVKRVSMPNKGEKWKIMVDNKVVFTIESTKISKKEREFLSTVEGFNFTLAQAKIGIKSLNSFRTDLKKAMESKSPEKTRSSQKLKKKNK
jgi:hypothetical protein